MGSLLDDKTLDAILHTDDEFDLATSGLLDIKALEDPDEFVKRALRLDAVPETIGLSDSLGTTLPPEPVGFFEGVGRGITGGLIGDDPDELFSRGQAGELIGDAILFSLLLRGAGSGTFRASGRSFSGKAFVQDVADQDIQDVIQKVPKELLTKETVELLERASFGGVTGSVAGGAFTAITPEDDDFLIPLLALGGVAEAVLPGVFKKLVDKRKTSTNVLQDVEVPGSSKTAGEVSEELFALPDTNVPELIERELINVPNLPESKVRSSIQNLIKASDELDAHDGRVLSKNKKQISEFQFGKDNIRFHENLAEARQIAKNELDTLIMGKSGGRLTQLEKEFLMDSLPDNAILSRQEGLDIINNRLQRFQLDISNNPFKSTTPLRRNLDEFKLRMEKMEAAIVSGLNPNASMDNIIKAANRFADTMAEQGIKFAKSPARQAILRKGRKAIDDFINASKEEGLTPELAFTGELVDFAKRSGRFLNPDDATLRVDEVNQTVSSMIRKHSEFIDAMREDTRKAFVDEDMITRSTFNELEDSIVNSLPTEDLLSRVPRSKLVQYIDREIQSADLGALAPDLKTQETQLLKALSGASDSVEQKAVIQELKKLRQGINEQFFTDEAFAKQVIEASNNPLLRRASLLYRASLGDGRAVQELRGIQMASQSTFIRKAVNGQLITDNKGGLSDEATEVAGGSSGGKPPGRNKSDGFKDDSNIGEASSAETLVTEMAEAHRPFGAVEFLFRPLSRVFANRAVKTKSEFMRGVYEDAERLVRDTFLAENQIIRDRTEVYEPLLMALNKTVNDIPDRNLRESALKFIDRVSERANELIDEGKLTSEGITDEIQAMVRNQPESVQKVYNSYREITDKLWEETNKSIAEMNRLIKAGVVPGKELKPIPYRPGYVPYIYDGAFKIQVLEDITLASGKVVKKARWTEFVHSSDDAIKSLNKYFAQTGNTQGRIVITPKFITSEDESLLLGNVLNDLEKIYGRPAVEVNKLLKDKTLSRDTLNDIFFGNRMKRTLNLDENRLDTLQALNLLIHNNQRFQNYTPLYRRMQVIRDRFDERGFTSEAKALDLYYDDLIGRSRKSEQAVDGFINNAIGNLWDNPITSRLLSGIGLERNGRVVRSVASTLNLFGRLSVLGYNPSSAVVNAFIIPTNVAPTIGIRNTMFGLRHLKDAFRTSNPDNKFNALFKHIGIDIRPTSFGFRETVNDVILKKGASKWLDMLDSYGMSMFNSTENMARGVTSIGAVNQAKQIARRLIKEGAEPNTWQEKRLVRIAKELGRPMDDQLTQFEYARFIVDKTNFRFTLADTPELLRQPLLRPMMQFKSFFLKEMDLFFFDNEFTTKERFMAFGLLGTLGGAMAMPFTEEIDRFARFQFGMSPKLWMQQNLPEVTAIGFGSLFGVDFSQRANFGEISSLFSNPAGIALPRFVSGVGAVARGDREVAAAQLIPVGFNNMMDTLEFINKGEIRSPFTGNVKTTSEDITSTPQLFLRFAGFKTVGEMNAVRSIRAAKATVKKAQSVKRSALKVYLDAVDDGDDVKARRIRKEFELTDRSIKEGLRRRGLTRKEMIKERVGKNLIKQNPELLEDL